MLNFIKLTREKIRTKLDETLESIEIKKEDIIDKFSNTKDKIVNKLKEGKEKFIDIVSNAVDKIKEKIENNKENEITPEYQKEKYEAMGNNSLYTSDENWGICPITQCYMENPVITPSGNYYEKKAILDWIKKNPTDPITREKLTPDLLVEDIEYKNAIQEYIKKQNYTI